MALVSIIMAAYNAAGTIGRSIESVLSQTIKDWELLIVDDGSVDDTLRVISTYNDSRIRLVTKKNGGVSSARNSGLDIARGKYICFLDADDTLPMCSIVSRLELLENVGQDAFCEGCVETKYTDSQLESRLFVPLPTNNLLPHLLRLDSRRFFGITYMFPRKLVGNIRFDPSLSHSEDIYFFISLCYGRKIRLLTTAAITYEYHVWSGSAMSNLNSLCMSYDQLYFKLISLRSKFPVSYTVGILKAARIVFLISSRNFSFLVSARRAIGVVSNIMKML